MTGGVGSARIAVRPRVSWLEEAVAAGGGEPVGDDGPFDAVVWADPRDAGGLRALLDEHAEVRWVQLPFAGIEPFVPVLDRDREWTCGKGVYAEPVAEHALMLALAGLRGLATYARATSWQKPQGHNLLGANVVIVGGGGIAESLVRLLGPWHTTITVARRSPVVLPGTVGTISLGELDDVLPAADVVFLALALTPQTRGLFDERRLRLLPSHGWLVNVARGGHVVTDDVVTVLAEGAIGGYATDVTDPEPLPEGHPLWREPRFLCTPHIGNTPEMGVPLLAERVRANTARFVAGEPLVGPVDVDEGY